MDSQSNLALPSKPSRFSSLKVFKFGRDKDNLKPPPLPPKDPYYLTNRSLASLSPESQSFPTTPLSPPGQYANRVAPSMPSNNSTMSLVSSSASQSSYSPGDMGSQRPGPKRNKSSNNFFKFAKISPRSPSSTSIRGEPPETPEDESISLPWGFQHNVHVDDSFGGLPPSWTASLAERGFTEDEIAAIQTRRAASRSPGPQYMYGDRPRSPAGSVTTMSSSAHHSQNPSGPIRPAPRTTSLRRELSDTSLNRNLSRPGSSLGSSPSQTSLHSVNVTPVKNGLPSNPRKTPPSVGHKRLGSGSSLSLSLSMEDIREKPRPGRGASKETGLSPIQTAGISPSEAVKGTPAPGSPKRTFHITNGPPPILSPPPSYQANQTNGFPVDYKDRSLFDNASSSISQTKPLQPSYVNPQRHKAQASTDSINSRGTPPRNERRRSKRFNALPPRLSLNNADISQWTEALLSSVPSELSGEDHTPSSSTFAQAQAQVIGNSPVSFSPTSPRDSPRSARASPSQFGPSKPAPTTRLPALPPNAESSSSKFIQDDLLSPSPPASASAPLFQELSNLVGVPYKSPEGVSRYGAPALTEVHSPTIPISPDEIGNIIKGRNPNRDAPNRVKDRAPNKDGSRKSGWADEEEGFEDEEGEFEIDSYLRADPNGGGNRDSSRYSSRSSTSTVTMTSAIVKNASVARMAVANVIEKPRPPALMKMAPGVARASSKDGLLPSPTNAVGPNRQQKAPPSPQGSQFGSSEESSAGSGSSSSQSNEHQTPNTEIDMGSSLMYYMEPSPGPEDTFDGKIGQPMRKPTKDESMGLWRTDGDDDINIDVDDDFEEGQIVSIPNTAPRPHIIISKEKVAPGPLTALNASLTPMTPAQRYGGWLTTVVKPLEEFIDEPIDPRDYYIDLEEIAEGESGSVFRATLSDKPAARLKLPPLVKAKDMENQENGVTTLVALKVVEILPSGSPKLIDLEHELKLLRGMMHANILNMDALYVDLVEDSLWIRMELMERSLADVISLVESGLTFADRAMARFTSDILEALQYLQEHRIAHRDVRSDNLLINQDGILKLTDFSNALRCTKESTISIEVVGVPYWQAPEMRAGPYDALKVDVWSLGATVWEMAQTEPPFADSQEFADRWPPLKQPDLYTPAFHEFLRLCSEPHATRPDPRTLSKNSFVMNSCGRHVIIQLLSQCQAIEKVLQEAEENDDS